MTTSKLPCSSLPGIPAQASEETGARHRGGHARAIARARAQLPQAELPLSQRDAQWCWRANMGFQAAGPG